MEPLDYWRFCHELTVVQATLLIIGLDPTPHFGYICGWKPEEQPLGYAAVFTALQNDILSNRLSATVQTIPMQYGETGDDTDRDRTRVSVQDLKGWLSKRGVTSGFFFPERPIAVEYLNRSDPNFSPKLAAAVEAWKAVKAERAIRSSGKSVKTDLTKWLNIHASEYGLANETASLTNWQSKRLRKSLIGTKRAACRRLRETSPPIQEPRE